MDQLALFADLPAAPARLPPGLRYEPGLLDAAEASRLVTLLQHLPLAPARYKGHVARRRVLSYGHGFDFDTLRLQPAPGLIPALQPVRDRAPAWAGIPPRDLAHALLAAYPPGAPLGWHRDVPDFEDVIGLSLGAAAEMRWRPWPPGSGGRADTLRLTLAPGSVYLMQGEARWGWQHSLPPVPDWRWSITFRTLRRGTRYAGG